jgi:hypothetical protein
MAVRECILAKQQCISDILPTSWRKVASSSSVMVSALATTGITVT